MPTRTGKLKITQNSIAMRTIATLMIASLLTLCTIQTQAQNKSTSKSSKSKQNQKVEAEKPQEHQLPSNSNDCLFAIPLQLEIPYGPTTAPKGAGRIQEIVREKNNPNVFEFEHNSVWFKFTVPYNGNLEIDIMPNSPLDDYDFLVYKYTDDYFSNRLIEGRIKPIAGSLSSPDTNAINKAYPMQRPKTPTTGAPQSRPNPNGQKTQQVRYKAPTMSTLGMKVSATKTFVPKSSTEGFVKSIPVRKGEVYYIVVDNLNNEGNGLTIKASIQVSSYTPTVLFYDPVAKKNLEVDLLILEKNTDNRPVVKNPTFRGGQVKFVPGFNYTLYAKKDGYFPVYKDFNSNIFKEDTMMRFHMNRATVGTVFPISDIYFNDDAELLPESDTVLLNYITMFKNYPGVQFTIKGYVASYGVDLQGDMRISLARAESTKEFFVKHGIDASRIKVAGMTQNEIKRAAAAALNKSQSFKGTKVELIINQVNK